MCIAVYGECGRAFCDHGVKRVWGLQWSLGHGFIGLEWGMGFISSAGPSCQRGLCIVRCGSNPLGFWDVPHLL